jgi:membrane protease YdiL (CAAX protease family)
VLGVTQGRAGVGRLVRSMVRWRVPARAYLFALGAPVLASGVAVVATIATGAHPDAAAVATWSAIPLTIAAVLLIPGMGGAWEEPGFRGYALPRLEQRFGILAGPLLLGAFWVAWHLPLFLAGQILATDVLTIIAASVVTAGVFDSARQSVLIVMLLHATNNAVGGGYASPLFHGSDSLTLGLCTAAMWWILAVVVTVRRAARWRIAPTGLRSRFRSEVAQPDQPIVSRNSSIAVTIRPSTAIESVSGPGTIRPWSAPSTSSTNGDTRRAATGSHQASAVPPTSSDGAVARASAAVTHGMVSSGVSQTAGRARSAASAAAFDPSDFAISSGRSSTASSSAPISSLTQPSTPAASGSVGNGSGHVCRCSVAPRRSATTPAYISIPAAGPNFPPGITTASATPRTLSIRGNGR